MDDEWIPAGPLLCGEDFADGIRIERVCAEAVHRLCGEGDQSTRPQNRSGAFDRVTLGRLWVDPDHRTFHSWQDKLLCYDGRAKMKNTAILLVDCPDQKGIVAAISGFLFRHNANILHADQHQDADVGLFLTRVEWDLKDFKLEIADFGRAFAPVAEKFHMRWRLELSAARPHLAIFVSKYDHCLADLLYRHESG